MGIMLHELKKPTWDSIEKPEKFPDVELSNLIGLMETYLVSCIKIPLIFFLG